MRYVKKVPSLVLNTIVKKSDHQNNDLSSTLKYNRICKNITYLIGDYQHGLMDLDKENQQVAKVQFINANLLMMLI